MNAPLDTGPPVGLGSGRPPARRGETTSIFDIPDEEELLKTGEKHVEAMAAFVRHVRTEAWDMQCGACVLGEVASVFPGFSGVLTDRGIQVARVLGAWAVPPFVLKDLEHNKGSQHLLWRQVRGRLAPFLKNDLWKRVDAEVRQGRAVDWEAMCILGENSVVVKFYRPSHPHHPNPTHPNPIPSHPLSTPLHSSPLLSTPFHPSPSLPTRCHPAPRHLIVSRPHPA